MLVQALPGLAAAARLNSFGHDVTVFEKADDPGGLLRYGIPDFKLEKHVVDRRLDLMKQEGVVFKTNVNVGIDISSKELMKDFDAVLLTGGSSVPRDMKVEGRVLEGIYFALDFLAARTEKVSGKKLDGNDIDAKDKIVVVIGGGDTGSDCIGTAIRQGAKEVYQYEIMPKPPADRDESMPWPEFPRTLKTSTSHEEGCVREWCIETGRFSGKDGRLTTLYGSRVNWVKSSDGRTVMEKVEGSEFEQQVDMVILAMGFIYPQHEGLIDQLDLKLDPRGNVQTDENHMASEMGVFAAGDMRMGQSLIVRAIYDGRQAARHMDDYLMKE